MEGTVVRTCWLALTNTLSQEGMERASWRLVEQARRGRRGRRRGGGREWDTGEGGRKGRGEGPGDSVLLIFPVGHRDPCS